MTTLDQCQLQSIHGDTFAIDETNGKHRIIGARVIQAGPLNDGDIRPWYVDGDTLEQVVNLGNYPNKGIRARFTHPRGNGLGRHLGRWTNFRIDGDVVRADLEISPSSFASPEGDLGGYVLQLAKDDPEAFGVSIAPVLDFASMQELEQEDGTQPIRLENLHAADVVDEPAATRGGMFERSTVSETPSEEISDMADEVTFTVDREQVSTDAAPYVEEFGDIGARWYLEGRELLDCYREQCNSQNEVIDQLRREIEVLNEQLSAAVDAAGEADPVSVEEHVEVDEDEAKRLERIEAYRKKGMTESQARVASFFDRRK